MIQDIAPKIFHNPYRTDKFSQPDDFVFHFNGNTFLVSADEQPTLPRMKDFDDLKQVVYLFSIDAEDFYFALDETVNASENFSYRELVDLRRKKIWTQEKMFAAFTAYHLSDWYCKSRYCGACGHKMIHDKIERAMRCPSCNNIVYPRINPAVIVGVIDGEKLLLTKYASNRRVPYFALIAGFVEIGETLEECVRREVMEEVGLHVKNIRYYKSQPWGIASDILAGFYCEVDGDPAVKIDYGELKQAVWVPRAEIIGQPDNFSLTHEMMIAFKNGK